MLYDFKKLFVSLLVPAVIVGCGKAKESTANKEAYGSSSKVADAGAVNSLSPDSFVPDRVFFDFDSASLTSDAVKSLQTQADFLVKNKHSVIVEGHADERGTDAYNMSLGLKRAQSVKAQLAKLGVPTGKIKVVTYGKHKLAVPGDSEDAHAKNRRSVTVLVSSKK